MGKGDKKTRRGKIHLGTFGVRRPRVKKSTQPKAKTSVKKKAKTSVTKKAKT